MYRQTVFRVASTSYLSQIILRNLLNICNVGRNQPNLKYMFVKERNEDFHSACVELFAENVEDWQPQNSYKVRQYLQVSPNFVKRDAF